jgi:lipopolysaccharide/colanic/teichoic acid biosynthesis glycosyltransferase
MHKNHKQSSNVKISKYALSVTKRLFDIIVVLIVSPLVVLILAIASLIQVLLAGRPIIFTQERVGKKGKLFKIYKCRTMCINAETMQKRYVHLNKAQWPVFKIDNDPRFVGIGRFLSQSGIDEMPQLLNVIKGDMSLIGPRPLPPHEESHIQSNIQAVRRSISPGIMSAWVLQGSHQLTFSEWMDLDLQYAQSVHLKEDYTILVKVLIHQIYRILKLPFRITK